MEQERLWLFDGTNFDNWKFRIEVLLEDRNLLDCLEKAVDEEEYAVQLETDTTWKCKNLLVDRIAENQLEYVKGKQTAKDAWDALRNIFERVGIAGKLFLKKQFQELRLSEGGDVKSFLLQFEKVLRDLKAAGVKMEAEDVVCQLLLSLPKSYDPLITALETIEPNQLTLEYVKKRLLDEEVKRIHRAPQSDEECRSSESAFAGRKRILRCFGCGRTGHKKPECPDGGSGDETEPEKNQVKRYGKSFQRQEAAVKKSDENDIAFVATGNGGRSSPTVIERKIEWFLDSGATDHMACDETIFEEIRPLARKVQISVAKSGQTLVAESAGTVRVQMLVDGKWKLGVVNDVLFVPGLQCNLFSVRRLEDNGMLIKIGGGKVSIEKQGRVVCCGNRKGQLYALDIYLRQGASAMVSKEEVDAADVWEDAVDWLEESVALAGPMKLREDLKRESSCKMKSDTNLAFVLMALACPEDLELKTSRSHGSSYRRRQRRRLMLESKNYLYVQRF